MSLLEGDADFKWGAAKPTIGGNCYHSFTYKGVEYSLYDCIYMLHEKNLDTSIGKIVKMWESPTGENKLRIVWFFRPRDVIRFLGDHVPQWNELFLACGEGQGLKDIVEVGNVLGKCNVICRSDDPRNPAASVSAENKADFYFSFTFDVGTKKASKHFPDQVDKVRIEEFFNTSESQPRVSILPQKRQVRFDDTDLTSASQKPKDVLYKQDSAGVVNLSFNKNAMIEKDGSQRILRHPGEAGSTSSVADQPLKKRVLNQSVHSDEEDKAMRIKQDRVNVSVDHPLKKRGLYQSVHSDEEDKAMRFKQDRANVSVEHPLKKRGLNYSVHQDEEDTANPVRKRINLGHGNASIPVSVQKENRRDAPDVSGTLTVNREHSHGTRRLHNGDEVRTTAKVVREGEKAGSKVIEVTKKPILDVKWFSEEPWEVRLRSAHEERKLVFVTNLDPTYTSSDVEDIIWSTFHVKADAKIISHVANSCTQYGQAFVIFGKEETANFVMSELARRNLMQAGGRPIVAFRQKPLVKTGTSHGFPGHLVIDNSKLKRSDAQRDAVSTSHSAQDNTIEYDFAMEWRRTQEKFDRIWKRLHQKQEEERKKLEKEAKDTLAKSTLEQRAVRKEA